MGMNSATPKGSAAKVSAGRRRAARGCHLRAAARCEARKLRNVRKAAELGHATYAAKSTTSRGDYHREIEAPDGTKHHIPTIPPRSKGPFAPGWTVTPKSGGFTVSRSR